MKVVHQLGLAGYLETVRGHGGGLRLARAPDEINVGEVVRRTEPDFGLVACFRTDESCVIAPACTLSRVLDEAREAFLAVLDRYTLADLLEKRASLARLLTVAPLRPGKVLGSRLRRTPN
jgi:Rrf2 family nitric oxide-sensitive transcriptional repressor